MSSQLQELVSRVLWLGMWEKDTCTLYDFINHMTDVYDLRFMGRDLYDISTYLVFQQKLETSVNQRSYTEFCVGDVN